MPEWIQPLAQLLPLSFVSTDARNRQRRSRSDEILPSLLGIAVWLAISFLAATRLFLWKEVAS